MERSILKKLQTANKLCKAVGDRIYIAKAADDAAQYENYPQIILTCERIADAKHGTAGTLNVEIICTQEQEPEPIERMVRRALEGVFFKGAEIFLLRWQRSDVFSEPASERLPLIVGMQVIFDLYEFPLIILPELDALAALREYVSKWRVMVLGVHDFGEWFEPTKAKPALYLSAGKLKMARQMYTTAFMSAQIRWHVFAPDVPARVEWLASLQYELTFLKAIKLPDGSPLRLEGLELDFSADEIAGQLNSTWEFALARRFDHTHPINEKIMDVQSLHAEKSMNLRGNHERYVR